MCILGLRAYLSSLVPGVYCWGGWSILCYIHCTDKAQLGRNRCLQLHSWHLFWSYMQCTRSHTVATLTSMPISWLYVAKLQNTSDPWLWKIINLSNMHGNWPMICSFMHTIMYIVWTPAYLIARKICRVQFLRVVYHYHFRGFNFQSSTHSCPLCTVQSILFHGFNFQVIIYKKPWKLDPWKISRYMVLQILQKLITLTGQLPYTLYQEYTLDCTQASYISSLHFRVNWQWSNCARWCNDR